MKRKTKLIFLLSIVVIIGGLYGYSEYNRTNTDVQKAVAHISITAPDLIAAYEQDSGSFNEIYTDKIIEVHGKVKQVDAEENPVVMSLEADSGLSSVQCSMDSAHAMLYMNIKKGQTVTIKGVCTGGRTDAMFGTDVILNRCVPAAKQ